VWCNLAYAPGWLSGDPFDFAQGRLFTSPKSGCAPDDADGRSARSGALRVLLLRLSHSGYKVKVPTLVAKYATRIGHPHLCWVS